MTIGGLSFNCLSNFKTKTYYHDNNFIQKTYYFVVFAIY